MIEEKAQAIEVPPDEEGTPEPQPYPGKFKLLLKSRKFWAALLVLLLVLWLILVPTHVEYQCPLCRPLYQLVDGGSGGANYLLR
jgi:hypothetical protein